MVMYVKGDATKPQGDGNKIIAHICNDSGGWGAGFVLALDRISPRPQQAYRRAYREKFNHFLPLGSIEMVQVDSGVVVCNMVAQHGTVSKLNPKPLSYAALEFALKELCAVIAVSYLDATVHMPRIGAGLAGGDWNVIESIINKVLVSNGIDVTVYDL